MKNILLTSCLVFAFAVTSNSSELSGEQNNDMSLRLVIPLLAQRYDNETEPQKKSHSQTFKVVSVTVAGIKMVLIPGDSFEMGSNDGQNEEKPVHKVSLDAFYMSETEVTQRQYRRVMGANPSHFLGVNLPVECVNWYDAVIFCNRLSIKVGLERCYDENTWECDFKKNGFRLPTEAEWEYACRAGTSTKFYTGNSENNLAQAGWYGYDKGNSGERTHAVGRKIPNSWSLYDMHGNVWEWCNDWYDSSYYSNSEVNNPTGVHDSSCRVIRGGGWSYVASNCRSTIRYYSRPDDRFNDLGFRIVKARKE